MVCRVFQREKEIFLWWRLFFIGVIKSSLLYLSSPTDEIHFHTVFSAAVSSLAATERVDNVYIVKWYMKFFIYWTADVYNFSGAVFKFKAMWAMRAGSFSTPSTSHSESLLAGYRKVKQLLLNLLNEWILYIKEKLKLKTNFLLLNMQSCNHCRSLPCVFIPNLAKHFRSDE